MTDADSGMSVSPRCNVFELNTIHITQLRLPCAYPKQACSCLISRAFNTCCPEHALYLLRSHVGRELTEHYPMSPGLPVRARGKVLGVCPSSRWFTVCWPPSSSRTSTAKLSLKGFSNRGRLGMHSPRAVLWKGSRTS